MLDTRLLLKIPQNKRFMHKTDAWNFILKKGIFMKKLLDSFADRLHNAWEFWRIGFAARETGSRSGDESLVCFSSYVVRRHAERGRRN